MSCTRKFRNFWRSSFAVRKISDMLCLENGLSVIAEPKPSQGSYGTWLGEDKLPTVWGQLEGLIDTALGRGCKDFDSFLAAMKAAAQSKPNLLIDIQAKMQQINSPGFERWAKIFNLKEMAKTVMYLQENKKRYPEYKQAREKMIELLTAKNNVERILGVTEKEKNRGRQQEVR